MLTKTGEWDHETVNFAEELDHVLPADLPQRARLVEKADLHLRLIAAANEHMNLTRITDAREASVKHIYDSVAPWRLFQHAHRVLDAGTGAGFPGVPLAVIFPESRYLLTESVQKKARFVDTTVESLELANAHVYPQRAEEVAAAQKPDVITARAVAPLTRLLETFRKAMKAGSTLLLYKGPDVVHELSDAIKHGVEAEIVSRYELPHGLGVRTLVQMRANNRHLKNSR